MVTSDGLMANCLGLALFLAGSLAIGDQPEKRVVVQAEGHG